MSKNKFVQYVKKLEDRIKKLEGDKSSISIIEGKATFNILLGHVKELEKRVKILEDKKS